MNSRRKFIKKSTITTFGLPLIGLNKNGCMQSEVGLDKIFPSVISTWNNRKANEAAWKFITTGGSALDAVEQGVRVPEADPEDQSVGYGGRPDRKGIVTLDACIMDSNGNAGSVSFLQGIKHPISVARKVMEDTPHVMLTGAGATQFAIDNGFEQTNLLTEKSKQEFEEWKKTSKYKPVINIEQHDTIGMIAIDRKGDIAGACTTSGLAYKMHGRVGDSPIIGAGMFVDNEVGGAAATGMGEAVLKSLGSFLVVELMRQGRTPFEACKEAVMRIINKQQFEDIQVGYVAINKKGEHGAFSIQKGFNYVITQNEETQLIDGQFFRK